MSVMASKISWMKAFHRYAGWTAIVRYHLGLTPNLALLNVISTANEVQCDGHFRLDNAIKLDLPLLFLLNLVCLNDSALGDFVGFEIGETNQWTANSVKDVPGKKCRLERRQI